jgi:hypothetical protein
MVTARRAIAKLEPGSSEDDETNPPATQAADELALMLVE